jgi:integrase
MAYLKTRTRGSGASYVVCWTDSAGRECQRTYRDKTSANRALKERIAQESRDELPDERAAREPFEKVANDWLAVTARRVKRRTAESYETSLRVHVLPTFGSRRIGAITSRDIEQWLAALGETKMATKSIYNHYTPLSATFKYAVRHGIIRVNPCSGVDLPSDRDSAKFEGTPLTRSQVDQLVAELDRWPPYGLAGRFLSATGLRAAEFCGLMIANLDLDRGSVSVTRTVTRNRKLDEWVVGTPKTRRGRRDVPILDDDLIDAMAEYLDTHPRAGELSAPLFYGRATGGHDHDPTKPWDAHVFAQWHLKPAAARIGVPSLRLHDLRHTAATLWYEDGIPLSVISRWLGHASVAVTDQVYVHLRPNDDYTPWREQFRAARQSDQERSKPTS